MYSSIGKKLKGLAIALAIIGTVFSVIGGFSLISIDEDLIPAGFLYLLIGPVVSWISSWALYGFGELVDKTCDIERNTRVMAYATAPNQFSAPQNQYRAAPPVTPGYAAPVQPAQPAYSAPAQPAYSAPAQPAYAPPAQPAQPAYAAPINTTLMEPEEYENFMAAQPDPERIAQIERLHNQGLIDDQEYNQAIAKAQNERV